MNSDNKKKNSLPLKFFSYALMIFIMAGGLYTTYRQREKLNEFRQTGFYMDTYFEIIVVAPQKDENLVVKFINEAFNVFAQMEKKYNFHSSKSYLNFINKRVDAPIKDEEFLNLLNFSLDMSSKTGGAFDPTLGAVQVLYPIGEENPVPPDNNKVKEALAVSGFKKVKLKGNMLEKPAGLMIDLGGIVKGYAVEKAAEKILSGGFKNFIVNGGGNITTRGFNLSHELWRIGVENPRSAADIITILTLNNESVATSGDYQRYFFYNNVRYHHILDPQTGKPVQKTISATVIAPDAATADAMSTAAFVMGRKKGIPFLEKYDLEGIIIDEQGISVTKNLKSKIKINK